MLAHGNPLLAHAVASRCAGAGQVDGELLEETFAPGKTFSVGSGAGFADAR